MIKLLVRPKNGIFLVFVLSVFVLSLGAFSGDVRKDGKTSLAKTNATFMYLDFNNMFMPLDNTGVLADAGSGIASDKAGGAKGGRLGGDKGSVFLFSGGFFMSGFSNQKWGSSDTVQWGNGVLSASRITDYVPGPVGSTPSDSKNKLYLVTVQDVAFGPSWQDWKNAVAIGADFYDGDHDGTYSPVDKNGNGIWDPDEDRPDLIGDFTVWCIFNDNQTISNRRFTDVGPQGIQIGQSVFGFQSKGVVGNMLFVRYRIVNTGSVCDTMKQVYFSTACDPDIGDSGNDLVGCDTILSAGYVYNNGADGVFGNQPPCFMMDFFQGPLSYIPGVTFLDNNNNGIYDKGIDTPLKWATNVRGKVKGIDSIPGAMNLPLTSFTQYMQSHPSHGDPSTQNMLRYYLLGGRGSLGDSISACTWTYGNGSTLSNCAAINPKFMYSGDPVKGAGWINTSPIDQRMMTNAGPFKLAKNQPIDIVVAYVVATGQNALDAITVAKTYDKTAQKVFDANFPSPPPPPPIVADIATGDGFIDITWPTDKHFKYRAIDTVLNLDKRVQGFYVTAFSQNSKAASINGVTNSAYVTGYDMNDSINNIYTVRSNGGVDLRIAEGPANQKLDSLIYADPLKGRIKLRITSDPVDNTRPLIKGKEYFFTITQYTVDYKNIINKATKTLGPAGDYLDPTGSSVDEYESQMYRCVYGTDSYAPATVPGDGKQTQGASAGQIKYLIVNNAQLTGDNYSVEFFKDTVRSASSGNYVALWKLKNLTKNVTMIDSSNIYNFDSTNYSGTVTDGFVVRVKPQVPALGTGTYTPATAGTPAWYDQMLAASGTGLYYPGTDLSAGSLVPFIAGRTTAFSSDRLRKVEIRFGTAGKAYRYLNGYVGSAIGSRTSYVYGAGVAAKDTAGKGSVGLFGQGFVDVPFTAWVKDDKYKEERQLAVGFIEARSTSGGMPDGVWNPLDSLILTKEYIIVFDADYDQSGNQKEYTGGAFTVPGVTDPTTVWADVTKGFAIPSNAVGITARQRLIAASPWFNTMYVVGFQRATPTSTFSTGDKYTISVGNYPYTALDKFTFKTISKGELSIDQKKDLFNKVNVYPNPLLAYNPQSSYVSTIYPDEPFVTFSNLPTEVTIKIYSLSGVLLRTLTQADKGDGVTSPFLRWNLKNESRLRVASGMYFAIVSSPQYGEKILKFGIVLPQKQIRNY